MDYVVMGVEAKQTSCHSFRYLHSCWPIDRSFSYRWFFLHLRSCSFLKSSIFN
ncbi:hypothetical protein Hanom_Chr09g00802611 [Helianthus anomalus]